MSQAARFTRLLAGAVLLASLPTLPLLALHAEAATSIGGTYHPLTPSRILDTRTGTGGFPIAPLGAGAAIDVQVAGQGGIPASGVSAAVMNVTVTDTSTYSVLTLYPTGVSRPLASNLNWAPHVTVPNLVTVATGSGGRVTVYNAFGTADVVIDVEGYYTDTSSSPGPDGLYNPLVPSRLLDTRNGTGAPPGMVGPGQSLDLQVTGRGGVPPTGVEAVVLNVTVTNPTSAGVLTVYPTGLTRPLASNLNFVAGQTVPNRVMVGVGTHGMVTIYNPLGSTNVVADVNGWFTDSSIGGKGSWFIPVTPARILDSRVGIGGYSVPWGANTGHPVTVAGQGGVPLMTDPNPPTAVVANVTVTDTTAASNLTGWPDGTALPLASDLNWSPGLTVPNLAVIQVGSNGNVDMYNAFGCVDVIMDVVGWYSGPAATITPASGPPASPCPSGSNWLGRLNYWRATAGLPPLSENTTWSQGDGAHSLYMVKNQQITHYELPSLPYYSLAGDTAARDGNIEVSSTTSFTDPQAIDWWMKAPFHAMGMMDPRLTATGFGAYREVRSGWQAGFSLDVLRGNPFTPGMYSSPVYWPGNGMTVPLRSYTGGEFPDPLQACPGYAAPTGLPVFVEIGGNIPTAVTAHSFTGNGAPLASCVIDSTNATLASYLTPRGGVIVIPQAPLTPGVQYSVSLTINGAPYAWSFEVS